MQNFKEMLEVIIEIEKIMMWKRDQGKDLTIHSCEVFKAQDIQTNDLINFVKENIEKQINAQTSFEEKVMNEFIKLKADIGNIYNNQTMRK